MANLTIPIMLFMWLVGLIAGFAFGLGDSWLKLILYLYFALIILGVLIGIEVGKIIRSRI